LLQGGRLAVPAVVRAAAELAIGEELLGELEGDLLER
jgi:hypothetical protein